MATDVATFRVRFPEFADEATYPDERIQLFLDDAVEFHLGSKEARWCGKYDYAHAYLAAHLLVAANRTASGNTSIRQGPISSKTARGVSVSYAVAGIVYGVVSKARSNFDDSLMTTPYGERFLSIRDTCFGTVMVANQL